MTRISELEFTTEMRESVWQGHSVQTTSDAWRMIANERHAEQYIEEFGDVEIVHTGRGKHWEVPAFKVECDAYKALKAAHCAKYGSN